MCYNKCHSKFYEKKGDFYMTLKQKKTLKMLDIIAVILCIIEILVVRLILQYETNEDMQLLFLTFGIICLVMMIKSIRYINHEAK